MNPKSVSAVILLGILGLWLPAASAQTKTRAARPGSSQSQPEKASKTPAMLPLKDLVGINTDKTAREAAHQLAAETKGKVQAHAISKPGHADDGGVLEFQAVNGAGSSNSASTDIRMKGQQKSLLKNFHGTVYGATAGHGTAAGTAGGGAGGSSSNGKLNIFVEGQHAQASDPGSH